MAKKSTSTNDDVILDAGVEVNVDGRKFLLGRLPGTAIFKIPALFREIFIRGLPYVNLSGELEKTALGKNDMSTILFMGFPYAEYEILNFLSQMTGISVESFGDPDVVPLKAMTRMVLALDKHPDIQDFLGDAESLLSAIGSAWTGAISAVFPEFRQTLAEDSQEPSSD